MRRILTIVAVVAILATACANDDAVLDALPQDNGEATTGDDIVIAIGGDEIRLVSSLSGFDNCDALLDHLRTEGAKRVGPWGFNDGWYGGFDEVFLVQDGDMEDGGVDTAEEASFAEVDASLPSAAGSDGGAAALTEGVDFSGTNVQEIGVDEADVVKTDGERIYIVANQELVIVDVASRSVVGTVAVPNGDRAELFLDGDDILLVNQGWFEGDNFGYPEVGGAESSIAIDTQFFGGASQTTITRITIDGDTPRIVETLSVEGDYVSARAVDGIARIIVRSNPQYRFPFVFPQSESGNDRAEASNRDALLDSTLTDWLPSYTLLDANGSATDSGLIVPCEQVHSPTEFAGFGVLSLLTIDVDGTIDPSATTGVLAPGEVVYASPESVYVATTNWYDRAAFESGELDVARDQIEQNVTTSIHRFDIGSNSTAAYVASGSVDGQVRDSFSFSEHNGYLRVVTTTGNTWDETSESFLRVLKETDGELVEVASVGDMGNGESVQSVRFQGDVGYVVTFRQVDPLYTLDLSDPENPVIRGELKIPGFSSYLHPIGDGLVIGVGSDADEQSGQVTGSKVSLFDVSDLDNPQEIATWIGPDSWNNIGWDTHAFLWWAPENLAVVPMQTWDGEQWSGAVVLKIENGTITEVARIDHSDPNATTGQTDCSVVTEDDLPTTNEAEFQTDLEDMIFYGAGLVLDCAQGEAHSASGFDCFADQWTTDQAVSIGVEVEGDIVFCYPMGDGMPQISRSLVLPGGELWTVSSPWGWLGGSGPARLQVNDLISLDRLDAVNL